MDHDVPASGDAAVAAGRRGQCPAAMILRVLLTHPSSLCPARAWMVLHVVRRARIRSSLQFPFQPVCRVERWWRCTIDCSVRRSDSTIFFRVLLAHPLSRCPARVWIKLHVLRRARFSLPPCAGLWRLRLNSRPRSAYTVGGCIVL